ncbi:type II toxin-antitoxin system VapC family toxin [Chloroflexota bacterium]
MAVIDASVYIALVNAHEKEHSSSSAWFEQVRTAVESIVAPVILLSEVATALSCGVGDPTLAHRVVQQLARSQVIELLPVTLAMAEHAAVIAAEHRIRGCDAVYVALADQLNDTLVTLDRQQLERGAALVTVRSP